MTTRGGSSWPCPPGPSLPTVPAVRPALCAHARRAPPAVGGAFPWSAAGRLLHRPQPRRIQQTESPAAGAGGAQLGSPSEGAASVQEAQAPQQKAGLCGQSRLDAGQGGGPGPLEPGSEGMLGPRLGGNALPTPKLRGSHLPACYILVCVGKLGFLTEADGFWTRDVLPPGPHCGGCDCAEHEERSLRVSWCSRPPRPRFGLGSRPGAV